MSRLPLSELPTFLDKLRGYREEGERNRLTQVMRAAGLPAPTCIISTPSSTFKATMLRGSDFLSYLPRALIQFDSEYAHLVPIPVDTAIWDKVTVGVTYRRRGVMLAPVRKFINRLVEVGQSIAAAQWVRLSTPAAAACGRSGCGYSRRRRGYGP